MSKADPLNINTALAHALGVHDLTNVARIELVLEAGQLPRLTVIKQTFVRRGDGLDLELERVVQQLRLVPQEAE
jgi:hypothetical protein